MISTFGSNIGIDFLNIWSNVGIEIFQYLDQYAPRLSSGKDFSLLADSSDPARPCAPPLLSPKLLSELGTTLRDPN